MATSRAGKDAWKRGAVATDGYVCPVNAIHGYGARIHPVSSRLGKDAWKRGAITTAKCPKGDGYVCPVNAIPLGRGLRLGYGL